MSENAIIIRTDCKFQSKALNTATQGLYKAFAAMENGKKDACVILAKVEKNKSYSEDGFKSLAEYAERIGLNKSLAHKMENAGRLLISENEKVKDFADKADFSKLAIVSSLGEDKIAESIDSGELKPEMTQREVKEAKAAISSKSDTDTIAKDFHYVGGHWSENGFYPIDQTRADNRPEDFGEDYFGIDGVYSKAKDKDGNVVYFGLSLSGSMIYYKAERIKKEKKPVIKSAKNMTAEELQAKIAEYQALLAAQESGEK